MKFLYYKFRMLSWRAHKKLFDFRFVFLINVENAGICRAAMHAARYVFKY